MAFSKKGARSISVNNKNYYWVVKGDISIALSVMSEKSGTQVLHCNFDYIYKTEQGIEGEQLAVTPLIVRQVIEYCLENGWNPDDAGSALRFEVEVEKNSKALIFRR